MTTKTDFLAIDIGNTSTDFAIFQGEKIVKKWSVSTSKLRKYKPSKTLKFKDGIVSSVVPQALTILKPLFTNLFFLTPSFFTTKLGFSIDLKNPQEVGVDRLVNAYAGASLYEKPAIVIDFGTGTTFDILSKEGGYLGGAIVPGIGISADALFEKAAKIKKISILEPSKLIGKTTREAMLSGIVYGYASMVDGMVGRFKKELKRDLFVVATGGYAKLIMKYASQVDIIDKDLTLKGLNLIWKTWKKI